MSEPTATHPSPILRALNIARWAPSGDNSQPWRFEVLDEVSVRIHTKRELANPYEYKNGEPVLVALGALLESLRMAASAEGHTLAWTYDGYTEPMFIVTARLVAAQTAEDPLVPYITTRSVNRKPMKTTTLTTAEKEKLAASLGNNFRVIWLDSPADKRSSTALNIRAADIRLRIPEAYPIHKNMLEWHSTTSEQKMPVTTLPITPLTRQLMRWALGSWTRVHFMNRFMGGTLMPILETEIIPSLRCGAHFIIAATSPATDATTTIAYGIAVQRFWLTATALGLTLQPSYAPLIFAYYGNHDIAFTASPKIREKAARLGKKLHDFYATKNADIESVFFAGRIGTPYPDKSPSRSTRLPLEKLLG